MICQELSQVGVGFIDGLVISIFLGSMAMAASGLTYPFFSIIGVFSGMMTLGTQKLFVDSLGKGDKEKAQRVLSTAITVSIVISLVLFLLLFSCSGPVVRRADAGKDAISEIAKISEEIQNFCRQHGIDKRKSMLVALCYEEMACNIIQHNSQTKRRKISIDVFVAIIENKIYIRLRDNCLKFDVVEKYNTLKYDPEHPEKYIGIRLVMKSTESVEYMNTFGMNNLIITL